MVRIGKNLISKERRKRDLDIAFSKFEKASSRKRRRAFKQTGDFIGMQSEKLFKDSKEIKKKQRINKFKFKSFVKKFS